MRSHAKTFEHVHIEEMRRILEKSDGAYINCQNTPGWLWVWLALDLNFGLGQLLTGLAFAGLAFCWVGFLLGWLFAGSTFSRFGF